MHANINWQEGHELKKNSLMQNMGLTVGPTSRSMIIGVILAPFHKGLRLIVRLISVVAHWQIVY